MSDFVMYPDDLLSKWGFGDGDRLSDYIYENIPEFSYKINSHKLLEELVKRYLLPNLNKKVEIYYIETIHNPVRAEMIDGVYYENHYEHNDDGLLGETLVTVSKEQITEVIKQMIKAQKGE